MTREENNSLMIPSPPHKHHRAVRSALLAQRGVEKPPPSASKSLVRPPRAVNPSLEKCSTSALAGAVQCLPLTSNKPLRSALRWTTGPRQPRRLHPAPSLGARTCITLQSKDAGCPQHTEPKPGTRGLSPAKRSPQTPRRAGKSTPAPHPSPLPALRCFGPAGGSLFPSCSPAGKFLHAALPAVSAAPQR